MSLEFESRTLNTRLFKSPAKWLANRRKFK